MRLIDRRPFIFLTVVALLSFNAVGFSVSAHNNQQSRPNCPTTQLTCPDSINAGEKLTFTASVSGGDSQVTPTFNWTVSAGTIESGQGTSVIEVNTSEVPSDSTVTATVEVGGFDRECGYGSTVASCTSTVMKRPESRRFDEYGALKPNDENARLDNFAIELQNDPLVQGYIIAYGSRASRTGYAKKGAARAKSYLVKNRSLDPARVMVLDGGLREEPAFELWLVPSGAQPPAPTPMIAPGQAKPSKPRKVKGKKS